MICQQLSENCWYLLNRGLLACSRNEQIHKQERERIERAYALALTDKTMEDSAKEIGLEYDTTTKTFATREIPFALKTFFSEQDQIPSDPMLDIINQLKDGEINTNIIEDDFGYRVIKRLSIDDEGYTFEQILVRKRPFDQWFGEQATTIRVSILDKNLKEKVHRAYPNLWWIKD